MIVFVPERGHFIGRIFAIAQNRGQHRDQQGGGTCIKADPHGIGDHAGRCHIGHTEMAEHKGKNRTDHRTRADKCGLHRIARSMLIRTQAVADEGPKRLHRHIHAAIEQPQQQCCGQQPLRLRHAHQRQRGKHRTRQEIGPAPSEPAQPGAIRQMADNRLDEQPGQRRRHPQRGQIVDTAAQRLEHPAHIGVLQRKPDLDAEKAHADATQAKKGPARLVHAFSPRGYQFIASTACPQRGLFAGL